jgi:serine/threonine protein kinase
MAPEQIVAAKVDTRADTYSLGVIAYQLLTGQTPFNGETAVQTMMAHVNPPAPPMRSVCRDLDVPDWLEELLIAA